MATAPKIAPISAKDEELGRSQVFDPSKSKKEETSPESPSEPLKSPLFTKEYAFGLTGKGKKKTRKHKRKSKKTRKHRK